MDSKKYFDQKAQGWDSNPMHRERSETIAREILRLIPLSKQWTALEFGAGTGITSFLLGEHLREITLMDTSAEMIRIANEKIRSSGSSNLKTLNYDLENSDVTGETFNLIFTQMVLHHISDVDAILHKLSQMTKPGGFIAIADLYTEDGSFHGEGFTGHNGFEPGMIASILEREGFQVKSSAKCYTIKKEIADGQTRNFDVFLIVANK